METMEIFERMAAGYDTEERVRAGAVIAAAIRGELGGARYKRAMDYGCGTGLVGLGLADLFESILLVDASEQMVAQVQAKIDKNKVANAAALRFDLCAQTPPTDWQFDCIFLSQVLLHVPDYRLLLERLYAALGGGGRLVLVDFDKNENVVSDKIHNGFERAELLRQLRELGFSSAAARTFYHGQKLMNQDASLFILSADK